MARTESLDMCKIGVLDSDGETEGSRRLNYSEMRLCLLLGKERRVFFEIGLNPVKNALGKPMLKRAAAQSILIG